MGRTNYKRGVEIERKAIEQLEQVGYIAMRTAGSHGHFDVIAVNQNGVRFIQCKREKEKLGNWDLLIEQLREIKVPMNATKELWVWVDREGWKLQEVVK